MIFAMRCDVMMCIIVIYTFHFSPLACLKYSPSTNLKSHLALLLEEFDISLSF